MNSITKEEFIQILKKRFEDNPNRHYDIKWEDLLKKIINNPIKLESLMEMEKTGGEPDVIKYNELNKTYIFCDCSIESPIGRRSLCYDQESLESRKTFKPIDSAAGMADKMGVKITNEEEYLYLQTLGDFDYKSTSWIDTPVEIRKLGGSLFGDKRYGRTFIYHNGAESYYASRGFRGIIEI